MPFGGRVGTPVPERPKGGIRAGRCAVSITAWPAVTAFAAVLKRTGVFAYVAVRAARRARGRPYRLMVLPVVATGSLSARQFSRYGPIVTAVTVTVAAAYVWSRYFVLV